MILKLVSEFSSPLRGQRLRQNVSRLLVTLVIGRRDTETARRAFADFYCRTDGDLTPLITSDEYAPYLTVVMDTYGVRKEELELTEEQKIEYG